MENADNSSLTGKVVIVSGGAGLLGRRFCHDIAERGGVVAVADIDFAAAKEVAEKISGAFPGRAYPVHLDITSEESVLQAIADVSEKYRVIDAVVNNAYPRNKNYGRKVEEVRYEDFCENTSLHLGGYFLMMQKFAAYFSKQGRGNIINMSSVYGVIPPRFAIYQDLSFTMPVEYAAIKSAVLHLTKYFAQFLKKDGVRVNAISPGGIFDSQPAAFVERYRDLSGEKGMLATADVSGVLMFLLSDASKMMTGQNLIVDDGFSL